MAITTLHELAGSPVERWDNGRFTAEQRFIVPWAERHELMALKLMYGGVTYPNSPPGIGQVFCRGATAVPFGGESALTSGYDDPNPPEGAVSTLTSYENALVTLFFGSPEGGDFVQNGNEYLSESITPTAEMMVLDHSRFAWGSNEGPALEPNEAPSFLLRGLEYELTRYDLRQLPQAAADLVGYVNDSTLVSRFLGLGFAAETLLFNPPVVVRSLNTAGEASLRASYRFTYRPTGWNKYWRAETQTWESIFIKGTGGQRYKSYKLGNFQQL